ncbi:glycosyltransferase family 2 protein [Reichenbachiella sp. MALMAid0571]|uniref:glycosyltransferase family 2 protein n=1 Tax=Reichenbachiella sp. MALMAid0571 TaxID=3143939 RepID=UPI0032DE6D76
MDQAQHSRLSVVIITFNEERNIGKCLDSVIDIADEIIVVDSFSTDNTKSICEGYDLKFIENKFDGHIEQKNFAILRSQFEYVLSLDADEVLSAELQAKILELKKEFSDDGYSFHRLTSYCGQWIKHCGWYPDSRIRLWNKNKGQWGGTNPHDLVRMNSDSTVQYCNEDILHYSYHSIDQHIGQINKFSSISAEEKARKGKKVNVIVHLILYPYWIFLKTYFLKLGFLDGYYGFVISVLNSYYRFLKYVKLKQILRS